MIKKAIKDLAYRVAPSTARNIDEHFWVLKHGRRLANELPGLSLEDKVRRLTERHPIQSNQKFTEILRLLQILLSDPPKRFCEIGDALGGTLALFCQVAAVNAHAITIDLVLTKAQKKAYKILRGNVATITCIDGDSHNEITLERTRTLLASEPLDFLFIDGDHSYEGVRKDFEMYSPLVRPGGIIAFHDIHPDYKTSRRIPTGCDVGEVPRYWAELKTQASGATELIEDPSQDGYGIGVIRAG